MTGRGLERVPAWALLVMAVVSIQVGSALAVLLFPTYGTMGTLFLRMALGGAILCFAYRRSLTAAIRREPLGILALGIVMAGQSLLHYESILRLPLGVAVAISFVGPLGLALATSRRAGDVLCVLLAAGGIALLTPDIGGDLNPVGVACAAASAAGWAAYILLCKRLANRLEGGVGLALTMATAALLLLPFAGAGAVTAAVTYPETILTLLGVALFSGALPMLFEYLALRTLTPTVYGVLVSLEPVVATLTGMIVLGETLGWRAWGAVALISIASAGVALLGRRRGVR